MHVLYVICGLLMLGFGVELALTKLGCITRGLGGLFYDDVMAYFGYDFLYLTMVMCHVCSMRNFLRWLLFLSNVSCIELKWMVWLFCYKILSLWLVIFGLLTNCFYRIEVILNYYFYMMLCDVIVLYMYTWFWIGLISKCKIYDFYQVIF